MKRSLLYPASGWSPLVREKDFLSSVGIVKMLLVSMPARQEHSFGMKKAWCSFTMSDALGAGCASWYVLLVLLSPSGNLEG